jgi:hypothetical protein
MNISMCPLLSIDITRAQVKDLLAARRAAGLGKNTVRLVRATLSVLFSDAVEDGLVPVNPAAGVGGLDLIRPEPHHPGHGPPPLPADLAGRCARRAR